MDKEEYLYGGGRRARIYRRSNTSNMNNPTIDKEKEKTITKSALWLCTDKYGNETKEEELCHKGVEKESDLFRKRNDIK